MLPLIVSIVLCDSNQMVPLIITSECSLLIFFVSDSNQLLPLIVTSELSIVLCDSSLLLIV